jgi:hypothetical protein
MGNAVTGDHPDATCPEAWALHACDEARQQESRLQSQPFAAPAGLLTC